MKGMLQKISLFFHTIRYLKPVQLYGRVIYKFYRPKQVSVKSLRIREPSGSFGSPGELKKQSFFPPCTFKFLNREKTLTGKSFWQDTGTDALWRYNLHYFDDLNSKNAAQRKKAHVLLINRWTDENPPGKGVGWDAYPLSLRIVNWVKWALKGNRFSFKQSSSLYVQSGWLYHKLEYHLLGNHLLANAKALIFAGLFFQGKLSGTWLDKGLKVFNDQIKEQILKDGGHFERSPMYHAIILEDVLDLIRISSVYPSKISSNCREEWLKTAYKMLAALEAMCHPDGQIGFFNDAAMGVALELSCLKSYACSLNIPLPPLNENKKSGWQWLFDTGYASIRKGPFFLMVDAAPLGPDYLPAHGHADTLSFEMSLGKQRVFVNTGTSCYGTAPERILQRKTKAHNTLTVDGKDSSCVWSGFRVAQRAKVSGVRLAGHNAESIIIKASHNGFTRLKEVGLHHRQWVVSDKAVEVNDHIEGYGQHKICIYFHLHPKINPMEIKDNSVFLESEGCRMGEIKIDKALKFCIEEDTYHPEFGITVPSVQLVAKGTVTLPFKCCNIFLLKGEYKP